MIKCRVIPCLLVREQVLVKTVRFWQYYRPVGTPRQAIRVFNLRNVDEMVILDIDATSQGSGFNIETMAELAKECFMPLTLGGGVRSVDDFRALLRAGADKVAVNTAAVEHPDLVSEAADTFGSQCVVVSIDARRQDDGRSEVFTHGGREPTGLDPVDWAREVERLGAGEILLTSIDRDGTMNGYDIEVVRSVAAPVNIPVIACGGAGKLEHFVEVVQDGQASAVAAGSIFYFTQVTPHNIKEHMKNAGIDVRL